jgi:glycerol uptake facilitator-like aquaporin
MVIFVGSLCAARRQETTHDRTNIFSPFSGRVHGTAILLAVIVGSGIMAERLGGGNMAIALLANTLAIGVALVALILMFAPVSGAHLNPIVSVAAAISRDMTWADAGIFALIQIAGALFGVAVANLMFDLPMFFAC